MSHLHIDCFVGISGDMSLAALLDLGVPPAEIERGLAGLAPGLRLGPFKVTRCGIAATALQLSIGGHGSEEPPAHPPGEHQHHHGLSYRECEDRISRAELLPRVRERSLAILKAVGSAEAAVHGCELAAVHFHELGGLDTLVDVCGVALGLEKLGVDTISAAPIPLAHGWLDCSHGRLPVPPPVVAKLVEGLPVVPVDIATETVTPTGAAIVKALAGSVGHIPPMRVERVGHGAGMRDLDPYPNVLRLYLGELDSTVPEAQVVELATQVDDCSAEVIAYACERALAEGALDAYCAPVVMKKGRPGTAITVIARPEDTQRLAALLLAETSSIGVRVSPASRVCLPRDSVTVSTRFGDVRAKVVTLPDGTRRAAPEYEDCARLAREHAVPLPAVMAEAIMGARGAH